MRIIFGHSANIFDEIVKTAFYVSRKTFCRKKLILQFHILGDMFRDFWQETRTTLSSFQNCTLRVEREFDRNSLAFFSLSQQGLQNGHWLCGVNFRRKIHFKRTIFIFTAFGRWPNCIYASRGTFCWEIRFWNFFRQFMILSRKIFGFDRNSLTFFSKPPSTSPQELLKECFFFWKNQTIVFNILEFWAKTIGCLISFWRQNCQKCILRVQMNT